MSIFALELAYWQQTLIRVLAATIVALTLTAAAVYLYLFKFVSFMQSRLGPMEAGPFGSLQGAFQPKVRHTGTPPCTHTHTHTQKMSYLQRLLFFRCVSGAL